jgi:indolepyruvate ferredoxin oxidoreductase beta subunit
MKPIPLAHDPYNLIITGVGGQGNVLASRILGDILSRLGYYVTIGETFGASQRGGSVMSHMRISSQGTFSPQIPRGKAHTVVALEPIEAIRVQKDYGNPDVNVLCSMRPIYPVDVIGGTAPYPHLEDVKKWIEALSATAWFIDPTQEALKLGNPIFANVITVGALAAMEVLPITRKDFESVIAERMSPDKVSVNLKAFDIGRSLIRKDPGPA